MEWLTFVVNLDELNLGKEVELIIKDLTPGVRKYESKRVKAIVTEAKPGEDILRVRFRTGVRHEKPFTIKILKELLLVPTKY